MISIPPLPRRFDTPPALPVWVCGSRLAGCRAPPPALPYTVPPSVRLACPAWSSSRLAWLAWVWDAGLMAGDLRKAGRMAGAQAFGHGGHASAVTGWHPGSSIAGPI